MIAEIGVDPAVGVLLIDVVLGYASHPDPAGALVPVLTELRARRDALTGVAHVCGTEADPQVRSRQVAALTQVGVLVAPTNAAAAALAAELVA